MEALARKILTRPVEIQIGGRSVVCSDVEQHIEVVETEDQKFFKLLELLGQFIDRGSVLVFTEKQEKADDLLKKLLGKGYACLSLHGGIDQYDRDSTISDFKAGNIKLLIATSVASRGLDVKQLILVVNYDCPNHHEDYVHRVGRTGRAGKKGYSWTFVTPDDERYCGDIIKALKESETEVPPLLDEIWIRYNMRQITAGKQARTRTGGGFSGKGFKFDDTEALLSIERKKIQKAALGINDSDDEDEAKDIDHKIDNMFSSKKSVKKQSLSDSVEAQLLAAAQTAMKQGIPLAIAAPTMASTSTTTVATTSATTTTTGATAKALPPSADNLKKLELAKRVAAKIQMNKGPGLKPGEGLSGLSGVTAPPPPAIVAGLVPAPGVANIATLGGEQLQKLAQAVLNSVAALPQVPQVSGKTIADQMAKKLNERLKYNPKGDDKANEDDESENGEGKLPGTQADSFITKYEEELEINDFPQNARSRVTSRDTMNQVAEFSDCSITVRGQYFPPKKEPKEGERKLYLSLEANNELAISKAKAEVKRLIKEELVRLQTTYQPANRGRYKVA